MTDPILNIQFTDSSVANKNPIVISATETNTSTSLRLHGIGSLTYGTDLWGNMVKLLENFCSDTRPNNATEGQLWYKPSTKSLQLYIRDNNSYFWKSVLTEGSSVGLVSQSDLDTELTNYLNKTSPSLTQPLTIPSEFTNNTLNSPTSSTNSNYAVTRKYVDAAVANNTATSLPYIDRSSDANATNRTMLKDLIIPSEFKNTSSTELVAADAVGNFNNAATRRYVIEKSSAALSDAKSYVDGKLPTGDNVYDKTKVVKVDGSNAMTSQLVLPRYNGYTTATVINAGDARLHAASREYVEDKIANNNSNLSTVFTNKGQVFNNTYRIGYFKNPTFMNSLLTQWLTLYTSTDSGILQNYVANAGWAVGKQWMVSNDNNNKIIRIKLPQPYTSLLHCSLTLVNPTGIIFEYSLQFVELEIDMQTIKCVVNHITGGSTSFPTDWGIMVYTVGV
jgi:hypothetical protein